MNINLNDTSCSSLLTVGLFGCVSTGGSVSNVVLESASVSGKCNATDYVGVLTGLNYGTVDNCTVTGTMVVSGATNMGGVIGENNGGVKAISSDMAITITGNKNYFVGGIIGRSFGDAVSDITVQGNIKVTSDRQVYVGGVAGDLGSILTTASANVDIAVTTRSQNGEKDYSYNYVGIIAGKSSSALNNITVGGVFNC